jgi:hypothetical protein
MGAFPSGTGGTIETGTFYETAFIDYSGSSGEMRHGILILDATADTLRSNEAKIGGSASITFATFTTSSNMLDLTQACGGSMMLSLGYTYASGVLTVFNPGGQNVTVWTKQ